VFRMVGLRSAHQRSVSSFFAEKMDARARILRAALLSYPAGASWNGLGVPIQQFRSGLIYDVGQEDGELDGGPSMMVGGPEGMMQRGKFGDVAGVRTYFIEEGRGAPLLLLHGAAPGACSDITWRDIIEPLSRNLHVYAMDQVGFGFSEKPVDKLDMEGRLDHIAGFIKWLGLDKISVLGLSAGGSLAMGVATRLPDLVERVIVVSSSPLTSAPAGGAVEPTFEAMKSFCLTNVNRKEVITRTLVRDLLHVHTSYGNYEAHLARKAIPFERERPVREAIAARFSGWEGKTLMIYGGKDKTPLDRTMTFFTSLPKAEMHIFGDCGHWLHFERPSSLIHEVHNFLLEYSGV